MERLEAFFRRYGKRRALTWLGPRPEGREGRLPKLIAARIGYPTADRDPFEPPGLLRLTLRQAAHVLAVAATTSLAYGPWIPREGHRKEALDALRDLAGDATFLSNGLWSGADRGWSPLSSATFDCGLIGYDASNAFIFWVEDED